jgi:hypothetical protein
VPAQAKHVAFDADARFQPVKTGAMMGVLVLVDHSPGKAVEYVEKQSMLEEEPAEGAAAAGDGNGRTTTGTAPANAMQAEPDAPDDMDLDD